jgi:hypothetical protein
VPTDWETHRNRADRTLEDLVVPLWTSPGGIGLHRAAVERYWEYLGTLDDEDKWRSIVQLLFELSLTIAWFARKVSPERPAETLADVRMSIVHVRSLTPLEVARIIELGNGPHS